MKNLFTILVVLAILTACSNDPKGNLIVNGTVDGLKVGKLYLQQLQDTALVNIDSVIVDGEKPFQMSATIEEPQVMYLYLDKKDGTLYDDRIAFFAQDTTFTINTTLEKFETDAVVSGAKNQDLFNQFNAVNDKLNEQYTVLFKRSMNLNETEAIHNLDSLNALSNDLDKHLKRKIGYAVNFAMLHKDYEVAPFILMKEGYETNPIFLDSAFNMMPKKIQSSRYGKQLSEFIKERKAEL